jgi:uncharacterized lipoprotein
MNSTYALRRLILAGLVAGLFASSGCAWIRGASPYAESPENRPLEVPPDLSLPNTTQAMRVPEAPAPRPAAVAPSSGFELADTPASTWRRVGVALERIDGVSISERAEVLGAYNLSYRGETFLVRVSAAGEGSRVAAVGSDGRELGSAAVAELLGNLRQRLQ